MHHRLSRLVIAAATAVALAGCGSSASSGDDAEAGDGGTAQVKVGVIPILDVAPIYLGDKQGFFKDRGIDLTLESGQGGAAIVPGVVSGQFQFGFSNVTSLMVAHSKGVPIQSVANGVASTGKDGADFGGVAVAKDSRIKSAEDLAGKKVAVNTLKNIGDTTVRESVRKAGGDPGDIEFTELAFDQMPAALSEGRVDAAWLVEPALSIAKAQGARVVASNFVDTAPDLTVATYFTSAKIAKEDPELVKKFTEAMNESLRYADEHPDEVRDILATYTKIDAELAKSLTLPRWPTGANRASIEKLAELGKNDGVFTKTPDLDALFR
ncbi:MULTISPECIES: ABC transporter substrate-binding protein [Streptomyces]|uniref:Nitrate ABC transporter substrate-binding protein n=2 Tax=Streptomyces TaxID=1883 RepID=A0A3R7EQL8_9ACTN|nr:MULTISPECIES: ABC transporter substrate-binding protein [Streptomyces]KNE79079.1 nitrate ABC transporter substrate-binding protein [Streptomyces fradiae]OFA51001.1 nitrate ABC transporter substrate-binding protein [Streptomyces fradiae]PQM19930.1 nitrate ABC transporter substrate-binding protein [Streptomyces xinghaiensis]RKM94067.1 nitrate ABC transporter substrate-binding protein [Streptomyces xinghaiensis]RNC69274.1 nitrate ABC transporter substrate-binding protein [Streptomyces xinghaie